MTAGSRPRATEGSTPWHVLEAREALDRLETGTEGLTEAEARGRLERVGPNALEAAKPVSAGRILLDQVKSVVVLLLFAAMVVALLVGDHLEAAAIGAVLLLNTGLGFFTELRARRAMEALLELDVPEARVVREGTVREVDARELVPGDVLELAEGESVPADARLLEAADLRVNEAPLTGESLPVAKRPERVLDAGTPLPERENMVYKATAVAAGSGRAVVVATGMETEVGRIGVLVGGLRDEKTPLERRLDILGRRLVWVTLGVAALVTGIGVLQGAPVARMIEAGIALAIAAVPEGLPAVATIALAVGLRRMARRNALIRRLPAVEALGSSTVVCTDKTGTLTAGQMTVTAVWAGGRVVQVSGSGYAPEGEFLEEGRALDPARDGPLAMTLRAGALANRADLVREDGGWRVRGDPTEAALLVAARKAGLDRERLLEEWPWEGEVPFSSERRLMATFHREDGGGLRACVKGAPGRILELSGRILMSEGERALEPAERDRLLQVNEEMAGRGLRVLGLATARVEAPEESELEDLTFLGFAGILDPPAEGVEETIARFREAGIRTVMLTGDQRRTAEAVARSLGVLTPEEETLDGRDLQRLGEEELAARVSGVGAFSRVGPEDKLKIVTAYQREGEVVAMLGDGVNDAPALKKADIGVAMGIRGTDVAKEASDVVLRDDRFPTLAAAVEEGRVVFDNIRKFVFYLFSCNLAEVLTLLLAGVAGLPLPLLPLQILWLNLVTDTFPALALAMEPPEPDIMRRPPRDPEAAILSPRFLRAIGFYAALITASTLSAFLLELEGAGGSYERAVTMGFMSLALAQIFHLGNARSPAPVLAPAAVLRNRYALAAVALSVSLQFLAVYFPPLSRVLHTVPLAPGDWLVVAPLAAMPAVVGQALRALRSRLEG